jgi:hypothetical protein
MIDPEFSVISRMLRALATLPDAAARERVAAYVFARRAAPWNRRSGAAAETDAEAETEAESGEADEVDPAPAEDPPATPFSMPFRSRRRSGETPAAPVVVE